MRRRGRREGGVVGVARVYDVLDVLLDVLWILCMCVNFSPQDG
jgi:hypothetical protein